MKHVITAWGELASGPGWANRIVNILECDEQGRLSIRYLQPDEQTAEVQILLGISAAISSQLTAAVTRTGGAA